VTSNDSIPIWRELNDESGIAALMDTFGNFHDGCIREIHVATSHYVDSKLWMHVDWPTTVHLLVQRQFHDPSAIELRFEEVVALRLCPPSPDCESIISDAACVWRDGILYWAENSRWTPDHPGSPECTWVAARRAWWRDASGWLGPDLRYRQGDEITHG